MRRQAGSRRRHPARRGAAAACARRGPQHQQAGDDACDADGDGPAHDPASDEQFVAVRGETARFGADDLQPVGELPHAVEVERVRGGPHALYLHSNVPATSILDGRPFRVDRPLFFALSAGRPPDVADAPAVEKQMIPVMAHVSLNFVMKLTFASVPVYVTIGAPTTAAAK